MSDSDSTNRQGRRIRHVRVSSEALLHMLMQDGHRAFSVTYFHEPTGRLLPLPGDTTVEAVFADAATGIVTLRLHSEKFGLVPDGALIPLLELSCQAWDRPPGAACSPEGAPGRVLRRVDLEPESLRCKVGSIDVNLDRNGIGLVKVEGRRVRAHGVAFRARAGERLVVTLELIAAEPQQGAGQQQLTGPGVGGQTGAAGQQGQQGPGQAGQQQGPVTDLPQAG